MSDPTSKASERESSIEGIVATFLSEYSNGCPPDIDSLVESHRDLMPELEAQLRKAKMIAAARKQVQHDTTAVLSSISEDEHQTAIGPHDGLTVRCPNCREPIVISVETPWSEITCSACGSPFSLVDNHYETLQAKPLKTLSHFELIERIGLGGFGSVWKARDTILDRTVAVKIPRVGQVNEEEADRFFREARAAAQLRHPNIVSIHEVGRSEDTVFIVSDLIRGITLADWLQMERPSFKTTAKLCVTIAKALHHAHQAGIVHRDLKPGNILIDDESQPHIMDFGLAKREAGEVTIAMDGQVIGTPAYMSPEQAKGEANTSDLRTDIYSLGVILFQLITGELPFRGNARMLIHQVIHDEPPPLRKFNNLVPRDLENICLRCIEKQPSSRYASANDVVDELNRFLNGQPVHARPIGRASKAIRWCKRKPVVTSLTSAIFLAVFAGVSVSAYFYVRENEANRRELQAKQERLDALEKAEQARSEFQAATSEFTIAMDATTFGSDDYRKRRHNARMRYVDQIWKTHPSQAIALLEDTVHCSPDERDFAWRYIWRRCLAEQQIIHDHSSEILEIAISKQKSIIAAQSDKLITGYDVSNFRRVWSMNLDQDAGSLMALDPGSGNLLLLTNSELKIVDANSGETIGQLGKLSSEVRELAVSNNGGQLAWIQADTGQFVVKYAPTDDLSAAQQIFHSTSPIHYVAFSKTGRFLGWVADQRLSVWDLNQNQLTYTPEIQVNQFVFHPRNDMHVAITNADGMLLEDLNSDSKLWKPRTHQTQKILCATNAKIVMGGQHLTVLSSETGAVDRVWDVPHGPIDKAGLSLDDRLLVVSGSNGILHFLRLPSALEKSDLVPIPKNSHAKMSPDGQMIATWHPQKSIFLTSPTKNERLHKISPNVQIDSVSFSKNHFWLAVGSDSSVLLYETKTGKKKHVLSHDSKVTNIAFSSDRKAIATVDLNQNVHIWQLRTQEKLHTRSLPMASAQVTAINILRADQSHAILLGFSDGRIASTLNNHDPVFATARHSGPVRQISVVNKGVGRLMQVLTLDHAGNPILQSISVPKKVDPQQKITFTSAKHIPVKAKLAAFSGNGKTLAIAQENSIQFWDGFTGTYRAQSEEFDTDVVDFAFRGRHSILARTETDKAFLLYAEVTGSMSNRRDLTLRETNGSVRCICKVLNDHHDEFFFVAGSKLEPKVLDLESRLIAEVWLQEQATCMRSSSDSSALLVGDRLGNVTVLRNPDSSSRIIWRAERGPIRDIVMAKGRCVTLSHDGKIKIWDMDRLAEPISSLNTDQIHPVNLALSESNRTVAVIGARGILISRMDADTDVVFSADFQDVDCVRFLPDSEDFAIVRTNQVLIYKRSKLRQRLEIVGTKSLDFSSNGQLMAVGTDAGRVIVLRTDEPGGQFVEESNFQPHSSPVASIAISKNGERVFSGSTDGTVVNRRLAKKSNPTTPENAIRESPNVSKILELFESQGGSKPKEGFPIPPKK